MFHIRCPPHSLIPHHKWARALVDAGLSHLLRSGVESSFLLFGNSELLEVGIEVIFQACLLLP